jgi:small subunit ribosomal protein S13
MIRKGTCHFEEGAMARIAGVDLPRNKRVEVGLTYIYGIGRASSNDILRQANVDPDKRIRDLTESEIVALRELIDRNYRVEGDLRREVQMDIKRLMEIGCYRGLRHRRNLPVRGQRTRTNARTKRGPKKTVPGRGRRRGAKKK